MNRNGKIFLSFYCFYPYTSCSCVIKIKRLVSFNCWTDEQTGVKIDVCLHITSLIFYLSKKYLCPSLKLLKSFIYINHMNNEHVWTSYKKKRQCNILFISYKTKIELFANSWLWLAVQKHISFGWMGLIWKLFTFITFAYKVFP